MVRIANLFISAPFQFWLDCPDELRSHEPLVAHHRIVRERLDRAATRRGRNERNVSM